MISRCFVDTSAWFSLLVAVDRNHSQVQNAYMQVHCDGARLSPAASCWELLHHLSRKGPIAGFYRS